MYSNLALKKEYKSNSLLEKYIEGMANKDKQSLVDFYEATKQDVYSFILSIIKNKEDAEDIFQEVYIKVYESSDSYQSYGKPLAWVIIIAKNLCYMKLRKKKKIIINIDEMYDLESDENLSDNVENKIILKSLFENINDEDRNIIILHIISGLKHNEIAKILDMKLSTVLSKYNRAIKKLRKILKEDMK